MYLYVCVPQVRLIIVDSVAFPFRQVTVCVCARIVCSRKTGKGVLDSDIREAQTESLVFGGGL